MKLKMIILIMVLGVTNIFGNSAFDPVVAHVKLNKAKLIKLGEVQEKIKLLEAQFKRELTVEEKNKLVDDMINNILIQQAADREGVVITEKMILDSLKQQNPGATDNQIKSSAEEQYGKPWDVIAEALIETYTAQQYVSAKGQEDLKKEAGIPTEAEVLEFFNKNKTQFVHPDLVRVDHIFFATTGESEAGINDLKTLADEYMLQIKQGKKSFDDIVNEVNSDDNKRTSGGELGFVMQGSPEHVKLLGDDFINKVFSLSMDGVNGVLRSESGLHIVVIKEKRSARLLSLNDIADPSSPQPVTVAQLIQQQLYQQRAGQAYVKVLEKIIGDLRKEAVIKKMDKALPWN